MPFYQQRQRLIARQEAAARGEAPELSSSFPATTKTRLAFVLRDHAPASFVHAFDIAMAATVDTVDAAMTGLLLREWGTDLDGKSALNFLQSSANDGQVLDIIEAWFPATSGLLERLTNRIDEPPWRLTNPRATQADYELIASSVRDRVNTILDEDDIAWQLHREVFIPRSSVAMHATIIEPVLALTSGNPGLMHVELAFGAALGEMRHGVPADAITDAGRALQETLVAVGARGNSIGSLLNDLRKKELITAYDSKLAEGIALIGEWVSADRSERGDAHREGDATRDDAWLAIRVSGALILRLLAGRR